MLQYVQAYALANFYTSTIVTFTVQNLVSCAPDVPITPYACVEMVYRSIVITYCFLQVNLLRY